MRLRIQNPSSRFHQLSYGDCYVAVLERFPCDSDDEETSRALFFIHGRYGMTDVWRPLTLQLARSFRCFEIDLPGLGGSFSARDRGYSLIEQARAVQAMIAHFGLGDRKAVLVGHDIGGAVAQLCAVQRPDSVSALVLINSTLLTRRPRDLATGMGCLRARRMLRKLLRLVPDGFSSDHRRRLSAVWRNREVRKAWVRAFAAWDHGWPTALEREFWNQELRSFTHPVLLLWGQRDCLNPFECAEELMRQFPDAYLFEHEGCGHWPTLEAHEWVHYKMREFLFHVGESRSSLFACGR